MKTSRFLKLFVVVFFGAAVMIVSPQAPRSTPSSAVFSLKDLPPIVLDKCIEVQKLIGRNSFSAMPNDFVLVTKYEERPDEESLGGAKGLNMYLVHGILLMENLKAAIVHDTALLVKVTTTDAESSRETVDEWILIDNNGDAKIDLGIFRETVTGEEKSATVSHNATLPENRLQELQSYYEEAARSLDRRVGEGAGSGCEIV